MTNVTLVLDEGDEIGSHYSGPEHVTVWLGMVPVRMSHEQGRQLRAKLDEML